MVVGSRAQVFHGTAKQTSGGLQICDLKKNKRGAIVSRMASARAKKENRLVKAGFVTQRGKFGVVQRGGVMTMDNIKDGYKITLKIGNKDIVFKVKSNQLTYNKNNIVFIYFNILSDVPDFNARYRRLVKDNDTKQEVLQLPSTEGFEINTIYTVDDIIEVNIPNS